MLGSKILVPALFVLLIGGCPKRQTTPRIVYVQPPPSVSPSGTDGAAVASPEPLTIQEPGTQLPEESTTPPLAANPAPQPQQDKKAKLPRTPPSHDAVDKPPTEVAPPTPTESPLQLQPQGGDVTDAAIGRRIEEITAELSDLERRGNLSEDQRRAINDATTFRTQSLDALHQHDLLRAKQLADKAGLLIKAVLGRP